MLKQTETLIKSEKTNPKQEIDNQKILAVLTDMNANLNSKDTNTANKKRNRLNQIKRTKDEREQENADQKANELKEQTNKEEGPIKAEIDEEMMAPVLDVHKLCTLKYKAPVTAEEPQYNFDTIVKIEDIDTITDIKDEFETQSQSNLNTKPKARKKRKKHGDDSDSESEVSEYNSDSDDDDDNRRKSKRDKKGKIKDEYEPRKYKRNTVKSEFNERSKMKIQKDFTRKPDYTYDFGEESDIENQVKNSNVEINEDYLKSINLKEIEPIQ
jgi:hypothetical protein